MDSPSAYYAVAKEAGAGAREAATYDASLATQRLNMGRCPFIYRLIILKGKARQLLGLFNPSANRIKSLKKL